jgi:surface-anchored protein
MEKVISLQISNDTTVESAETFSLTLTGPEAGGTATAVFTINDPPTISAISTQATAIDTATGAIAFTIADPETAAESLSVSATSSNPLLLPPAGIVLAGSAADRTITLTPAAGLAGSAQLTILVTDPGGAVAVRTFVLSVGPATSGTATAIPNPVPGEVVLTADESFTLNYSLADAAWVTSVTRSNTTLFNTPGTGSTSDLRTQPSSGGTARTLRIRPKDNSTRAGLYGLSTVALGFTGSGAPAAQTFNVRVNPRAVADNNLLGIPGTTSTFDVLANDVVPIAGHTFHITSVSTPANGTLSTAPGGKHLRYTPNPSHNGTDTFTYTVTVSSSDAFDGYQFTGTGYVKIGGYVVVDSATSSQHIDLDFDYMNGTWQQIIRTDAQVGGSVQSGTFSPSVLDADEGILFFDPSTRIPRPAQALFDVLGVPAGADVWYGPTSGSGNKLYLGIANESTSGNEAYTPVSDPRATSNAAWVATKLVGFSGPGHFTAFSGSEVAFDTFDGLNSPTDAASGENVTDTFWGLTGSHAHPAWYFTAPGNYTLTFETTVKANGGFITSPPTTFHVAVDTISGNSRLQENPPLARPDALAAVANGRAATLDVIANDSSEADGFEVLVLTGVGEASHGSTALAGDGKSVSYTPDPGFIGSDSFNYTVTDEHGGAADATVHVTVLQLSLAAWRQLHYGTSENTGPAANDEDPDEDGIPNLLEYAFQLDPAASSTHLLPQAVLAGGNLEMSFTPPPVVTGISWGAEWSSTLDPHDWQVIPSTGTAPLHLYQVPVMGKDRAFIRIRVSEP